MYTRFINNTERFPIMIKLGTNVKSKTHSDLEGDVVLINRTENIAVVKTWISDYEIMTVETFLSDLEEVK
tara:strand:+ start:1101 stop:1310 length:210 start_codon:yes stop_codon:yes gene_type:complete